MELVIDTDTCDRCGTCIAVCPADALLLRDSLVVDTARCTRCGTCVKVCPFGALAIKEPAFHSKPLAGV
jgi:ferredoxin